MSDAFYLEMRQVATELITEFGKLAYLSKPGGRSGPRNNPVLLPATAYPLRVVDLEEVTGDSVDGLTRVTTRTLYIAFDNLTSRQVVDGGEPLFDEGVIVTDGLLSGASPEKNDTILLRRKDGTYTSGHTILDLRTLQPGEITIMWEADVAR